MKCVNRSSREFKYLAKHHGVSIDKLELITHKYWIEKGSEDSFPSNAYIQAELGGIPYRETAKAVRDLWESRYKKPKTYKTKKGYQAAYNEAKRFFPEYAIVSYPNNEGNLTIVVRQPVAEIKTVKDYLKNPITDNQEQEDYELITANLIKELTENRNFAAATRLSARLDREKELSRHLDIVMSNIDSAAQSGEWSQESLDQLNNLINDIKDGRIHFQRTVGERRSLSEGISAIHEGASLILRASYGTSPKKQGNSQEEYERDAKQGKEQEKVIEAWAKAADLWLNDYTDEEGNKANSLDDLLDSQWKLFDYGSEATAYLYDNNTLLKAINLSHSNDNVAKALDSIALFNQQFPESALNVVGFGRDGLGHFKIIALQDLVEGNELTEEDWQDFIKKYKKNLGKNKNEEVSIYDLGHNNILKDKKGNYHVIDADAVYNTPEHGGNVKFVNSLSYTEKAFEEETPFDELQMAIESRKKPHPFTFKDGTTINAPFLVNQQQANALNEMNDFIHSDETSMTLSGYAGTGKTSLMEMLAQKMNKEYRKIIFSATTNKAAAVLKSRVSKSGFDAYTLNKVFGISVEVDSNKAYNAKNLVNVIKESKIISPGDVVVIDEASMINEENYKILNQIADMNDLKIIYVGDKAQLAPVNETEVSKVFRNNEGRVVELTQVERTDDNAILKEATDIRNGKELSGVSSFNDKGEGVAYIKNGNRQAINAVVSHFVPGLKEDSNYFRILAYTNDAVAKYNADVRRTLGYQGTIPHVGEPMIGYTNWGYEWKAKTYRFINSESYKVTKVGEPYMVSTSINGRSIQMQAIPITLEDSTGKENTFNYMDIKGNMQNRQAAIMLAQEKGRLWERARYLSGKAKGQILDTINSIDKFLFVNDEIVEDGRTLQNKVIDFGYALTVHKSQGSTFTHVLLDDVDIQKARTENSTNWNSLDLGNSEMDYLDAADATQVGELNELDLGIDDYNIANPSQPTAITNAPASASAQANTTTAANVRQQLEYVGVSRATDTVTIISNDVKKEDTPLNHIVEKPETSASQESSLQKPVEQMSSKEVWRYLSALQSTTKRSQITYTPKGQEKQTYTVENGHIYNSKGTEVYPGKTVHKNMVLANYAVQEGLAVVVKHPTSGEDYVVDNNQQITSVRTGKIMEWGEENGDRRKILAQAEKEFRGRITATKERGNTLNEQMLDQLKLIGLDLHYEDEMAQYLKEHGINSLQEFIGKKARTQFEQSLKKTRPDMSEAEIKSTLDFLHSLEDNKENTAYIKAAIRWIASRSLTLPQDHTKAYQAFELARKKHLDLQKYKTLGELITAPEMQPKKREKAKFNPDEAKTFSNKRAVTTEGGRVFTVYDVENTEEGQREVCKALAAHYEMSPWCLSTFTATGEPTQSAKNYWDHYNAIPRKIAFENGRPVAFSSSDSAFNGESRLLINGKSYPLISVNGNYGISLPNNVRREDNLVNSGLFETYEQDGKEWLSLGYYNLEHPNVALLNSNGVKVAKQSGSIKEKQEAWWDMEDTHEQDSLSDSIIADVNINDTQLHAAEVAAEGLGLIGRPDEIDTLVEMQQQHIPLTEANYRNFRQQQEENYRYNREVHERELLLAYEREGYPAPVNPIITEGFELPFIQTAEGEVRGFATPEGSLYFDRTVMSPEHGIHEYTHLWDRVVAKNNPELWHRGVALMKQISLWKDIENDENYGKKWKALKGMTPEKLESLIASEVHSRLTGVNGEQILDRLSKEKGQKGIIGKLKQWLLDFWKDLKATFSNWSQEDLDKLTLQDFTMMTIRDLADGFNPNTFQQAPVEKQSVNERINNATQKHQGNWSRQEAQNNPRILYIFTDNTDRDSGHGLIPDNSWYSKKYGTGHHFPTMTAAVVRGLDNSRPISTQRWYHQGAKGTTGRWTDANVEEFKSVIRAELQDIVEEFNTGKYDTIMFPDGDGLFNTSISNITKARTPQLYQALADLLHEYGFDSLIPADIKPSQNSQQPVQQQSAQQQNVPGPETKINIYAGTGENANLSNFAIRPFRHQFRSGAYKDFQSVEQAFQYIKANQFADTRANDGIARGGKSIEAEIMETTNGAKLRQLGKSVKELNVQAWDRASSAVMKELLKESFEQNPQALQRLLATGNATLTHTQDRGKWGTEFPRILMEVRDELRGSTINQQNNSSNNKIEYGNDFRRIQETVRRDSQGPSVAGRDIGQDARQRLAGVIGGQLRSLNGSLWGSSRDAVSSKGVHYNIHSDVNPQLFHDIFEVVRYYTQNGELVDLHDDYADCKCYLSDDGTCGFAIEPNGNLVSVFNLGLSRGFLSAIKDMVIDEGATHLDAFASSQQNLRLMYEHTLGAKVASSMDYNMELDQDNIAANHGNPQVVFMVMGKAAEGTVEERHFNKDQYDEAQAYQQSFIPQQTIQEIQETQAQQAETASDMDSFNQEYEAPEAEEKHPMMTKKEQEEVEMKLSEYDKLNKQIDNLNSSDFINASEVRHVAEQIMNAVSDEVSRIQKEEGLAEKLFPSLQVDKEKFDFTKATRKEIIETIGLPRLFDRAKELFNTETVDFDDLSIEQQADVIYENFDGILFFGTDVFAMNEGFGIKKNYKNGTYEMTDAIEISVDDQGNYQDSDSVKEQEDEQEHWQIEQRTLDVLSSATELVRMAIHECYIKDENGNKKRDAFGIPERVNPREAVQKILKWTKGSQSIEEMVSKLEARKNKNSWLEQLILRLNDKSGNESDLQSQFYGVMKKSRQSYNITQLDNNKYIVKFVNNNKSRQELFNTVNAKYVMGEMLLFQNGKLNKEALGTKDAVSKEAPFNLHKALTDLNVINDKLNHNEPLTEELFNEIVDNLTGVNNILGIYVPQEVLEEAINKENVAEMARYLGYIVDTLDDEVQFQNENPGKESTYKPLEFKTRNSIEGSLRNYLTPIANVMDETATNVVFEDGKMYQEYVTPSYMTLLMEKFHWDDKNFRKFLRQEYGSSEWFKYKGSDLETGWRFGWLKKLAADKNARDIFDHTVELNFNKHRYMKNMTPAEYAISVIAHYFAEKAEDKQTLVPAWYRVPMQSNKPSSEFIKFYSYREAGYKDTIAEEMYNLFLQEVSRIQTVNMRGLSKKNPDFIKNWDEKGRQFNFMPYLNAYLSNSKEIGNLLRDEKKDKKLATMIQQLERREKVENEAELAELVTQAIKNAMQEKADAILDNWEVTGILEAAKQVQGVEGTDAEVRAKLENFLWNDNFASINILQLTVGDIAAYKDSDDLQKRLAELHAPGIRANIHATDYKGNPVSDGKYRTFILTDFDDFISNVIDNISEIFDRKIEAAPESEKAGLRALKDSLVRPRTYNEDGSIKDKGGKYWNINVADAQGYSSPTSYRKKAFMFGKWSPHSEEIYQKLLEGEYNYTDLETAFQPLKPFVYSQMHKDVGVKGTDSAMDSPIQNMPMPFQAKNAEYLLIMADAIMRGAEKQGIKTGRPNILKAVYRVMEDSAYDGRTYDANGNVVNPGTYNGKGIDTVQFESAIKSGLQGKINIHQFMNQEGGEEAAYTFMMDQIYKWDDKGNRTNEYNTRTFVHEVSFDSYCMQQEVPAHFEGHHQAQGSQERMIIPSDLDMFTYDGKENFYEWTEADGTHRKVRADEFKREYEETIAANIEADLEDLKNLFQIHGDRRQQNIALSEILQTEILENPRYGTELFQACSVDKATGEFRIPKGDPIQAKRIEQLINSIIKARVNKQEIAGGPIVQVSNFGTSTQLNIKFHDKNGNILKSKDEFIPTDKYKTYEEYKKAEQAGIAYFEVFAPMWMKKKLFDEFADKNGNIDIEALEIINPDLLKMISYRIPTEDKYSIAPMKVVGFLPKEAGDAIMFPYELTEIDDSDFDVDKRYVMRKELNIINDVRRSDLQYALERKLTDSWEKAHKDQKVNKRWVKDQIRMFLDNPQEMKTADKLMASLWKEYVKMAYTTEEPPSQKAVNNNKILDMTWAVLTNEMTADKILNPGGFDNFKDIGYQIAAYKNSDKSWTELESMSVDDRKKLAIPNKDLTWMDAQLHYYHQNTSGSNLIGVFAVNKVAHATLESDGLRIAVDEICGENPFTIAGFEFSGQMELDPKYDTKGNLIGKTVGSGVSASADTAKEPTLDLMNINMSTAGIFNSMLRLGMPQREAALFMAQNAISEVLNEFNRQNLNGYASLDSIITKKIDEYEQEKSISEDSNIKSEEITETDLIRGLKPGNAKIDYKVLLAFQKLKAIASVVRKPTFATRFNSISSAVGPQIIDNIILKYKMDQFRSELSEEGTHVYTANGEPADIRTVFGMHPILRAFAETIDIADTMFRDMPAGSLGFADVIDAFPSELKDRLINDKKLLGKLSDFYQSYLLIQSGLIDANNLKRYIENFPKWFVEKKIQEKYPDNAFIQGISMQVSKKTGRTFLNVDTVGKKENEKEVYRSAWTDLHKQDPKLSEMLLTYWFFRGGIGFSPKTSTSLISNYVKENFSVEKDGNTVSYLDVYRHLNEVNPELLINQFIRNNWQEGKLVPKKGGKGTHYDYSKVPTRGILTINSQQDMNDLADVIWMRTKYNNQTYLWERIEDDYNGNLQFRRVKPLGDNAEYLEMSTEAINNPMSETTLDMEDWTSSENPPTSHTEDDVNQDNGKPIKTDTEKSKDISQMADMIYKFRQVGTKPLSKEEAQAQVEDIKKSDAQKKSIPYLMKVFEYNGIEVDKDNVIDKFNELC